MNLARLSKISIAGCVTGLAALLAIGLMALDEIAGSFATAALVFGVLSLLAFGTREEMSNTTSSSALSARMDRSAGSTNLPRPSGTKTAISSR